MKKKLSNPTKDFLEEIVELSDFDAPDIYYPLGLYPQLWYEYKKSHFPTDLLPSLQYYSGLGPRIFWALLKKHFPVVKE